MTQTFISKIQAAVLVKFKKKRERRRDRLIKFVIDEQGLSYVTVY